MTTPGTLDTTFGTSGKIAATTTNPATTLVQPDGKTISLATGVLFTSGGQLTTGLGINRFNTNGTLDTTFGSSGTINATFELGSDSAAIRRMEDGSILLIRETAPVIAGGLALYQLKITKYNSSGVLDTSFGTNGTLISSNSFVGFLDTFRTVLVLGNKILIGGPLNNNAGSVAVELYNSNGTRDTAFGTNGQVTGLGSRTGGISAALVQTDGKIVVAGSAGIFRLLANGSIDSTFTNVGAVSGLQNLLQQSDGKIIVGTSNNTIRLNADGTSDSTFASIPGGITTLQSDDKIIVGSTSGGDFQVRRYSRDGALDNTFGTNGLATVDFGGADNIKRLDFAADGRLYASGVDTNKVLSTAIFTGATVTPPPPPPPTPTNQAPVVANEIANQSAAIGTAFSFTVPANAFSDPDVGNTLTYSATVSDGGALPTWLTFDAATRTFSGTPPTGTSPINLRVKATDGGGLFATDDFALAIASAPPPATTQRITASPAGAASNGNSAGSSISGDGRYVTYTSDASNLVAGDTNGKNDFFLYDRTTNTNIRLSSERASGGGTISRNGRYVVYIDKDTSDQPILVVYDTVSRTTSQNLIPVAQFSSLGYFFFGGLQISDDGRYVSAYTGGSAAVVDRTANTFTTIAKATGTDLNQPAMAPDGTFVLYDQKDFTNSTNPNNGIYRYNIATGVSTKISSASMYDGGLVSGDSRYLHYNPGSNNPIQKLDLANNTLSAGDAGFLGVFTSANGVTTYRQTSEDGQFQITTANDAANIVTGDTNGFDDIFIGANGGGITPPPPPPPTPGGGVIPGLTLASNLFRTDGTFKGFGITPVSQKSTQPVSEIALFAVDDIAGKIGALSPGQAGYLQAALDLAKPIFSTLAPPFFNNSRREISLDPNKIYQAIEIVNGSLLEAQKQVAAGQTPTNLLFSLPDASGNSPIKITDSATGFKVSVNNDDLVLDVAKIAGTAPEVPIGAKSQNLAEGRLIDLTDYAGQTLKVSLTNQSSAFYENQIGFYEVEDAAGTITVNGKDLKPGDLGYAAGAVQNAILQSNKTDVKTDQAITGGKLFAPVVISQGSFSSFLANNPTNGGDGGVVHAYFNYIGANPDKVDHFRLLGNNTFGVEDIYGGGDRDFNDIVINMTFKP